MIPRGCNRDNINHDHHLALLRFTKVTRNHVPRWPIVLVMLEYWIPCSCLGIRSSQRFHRTWKRTWSTSACTIWIASGCCLLIGQPPFRFPCRVWNLMRSRTYLWRDQIQIWLPTYNLAHLYIWIFCWFPVQMLLKRVATTTYTASLSRWFGDK